MPLSLLRSMEVKAMPMSTVILHQMLVIHQTQAVDPSRSKYRIHYSNLEYASRWSIDLSTKSIQLTW